ncbi:unnamed protein product [Caenorhabditis angaria]|uniref:Uncharacterized protein n=1 Tax=Caenorhabditis angaria TaxID=860376 RepID=A0A9P1N6A4_9PELO|nr:unnamed protein product [Caenorhabditis angaria]
MHPTVSIAPKKIGMASTSSGIKKAKTTAQVRFNAEERAELKKLSAMLPPTPKSTDPSQVVFQAATYIQQLVATVQARVNNGTLPKEALDALPPAFAKVRKSSKKQRRSVEKKR